MNRLVAQLRLDIRAQLQRIWIATGLMRMGNNGESLSEVEAATMEVLRLVEELTTLKPPRRERMASTKNYTVDKILDLAGIAVPAIPMFFTGLPGWAMGLCALGAYVLGKAGGRGVPLYSSFTAQKKDARGQRADAESPR